MGFTKLPQGLIKGRIFEQFIVDSNSVKLEFSKDLGIVIQTNIRQQINSDIYYDYDIWNERSILILNNFLRREVVADKILNDSSFLIMFENNMSIMLNINDNIKYESVVLYINGNCEYVI
jgi:hypothetical protein